MKAARRTDRNSAGHGTAARTRIAATLLAGFGAAAAHAAPLPGTPAGGEIPVNVFGVGSQRAVVSAMDADGNFAVAWMSTESDGNDWGIVARLFDRNGAPLGNEFQVNEYSTQAQISPAIAMDRDGDFFISWTSVFQDGSQGGVFGRRYDRNGNPVGGELLVNRVTANVEEEPAVALDRDGNLIFVAFEASDGGSNVEIMVERFNWAGNRLGGAPVTANTFTTYPQVDPAVASSEDGEFVVVWLSFLQDGDGTGIYGQRFDSAGLPKGVEFQVNSTTAGDQSDPAVSMDADGDFVVVWRSIGQDGDGSGIFGQRFDSNGVIYGPEFAVNAYTTGDQHRPSVALDADGDFAVAWQSDAQDGSSYAAMVRRFSRDAVAHGPEVQANIWTTSSQSMPSVAMSATGAFAVAWSSIGQDADSYAVIARRYEGYRALAGAVPDLNGNLTPEIAGVAWNGSQWQARVRDGYTGELLGSVNFSAGYDVADFAFYGDALSPQLAAYARKPDGTLNRLELRPLAGGSSGVNVAATRPLRMAVIGDANNNGTADFALLDVNDTTGAARTIVREGSTLGNVRTTNLPADWRPVDLAVLPDISGNARPELAVLAQHETTGAVRVESRDAFTGTLINSTDFNPDFTPARLAIAPDTNGGGRPELVVAGVDDLFQQATVQVLDSVTDRIVGTLRFDTWAPVEGIAVLPDQDGSGKPEIALLQQDGASDRPRIEIRDADTNAFVRTFTYSANLVARDLVLLDEYDGVGGPELAVVAIRKGDGIDRLQVRDSVDGGIVKNSPLP